MSNYATYLFRTGQLADAERLYRTALEIRSATLGDDNFETIQTAKQIAVVLRARGDAEAAAPMLEDAIVRYRAVLGEATPSTVEAMTSLVDVYLALDRLDEADALSAEAVTIARQVFPPEHWRLGGALLERARSLAALARHEEAAGAYLEAREILDNALGSSHQQTQAAIEGLVAAYEAWHEADPDAGHDAEAELWRAMLEASAPATD